jgi:hypothetical protein
MNTSQLPLLIKGYNTDLNGTTNNTLTPTASTISWNNVFDSGRGDLIAIDGIETGRPQVYAQDTGALCTISVAGIQVVSGTNASDFAPYANPGNYFIIPLVQPGGQTLSLSLSGGSGLHGFQVLGFYKNPFNVEKITSRLNYSKLKRRCQSFFFDITSNTKNQQSQQFTIPQSQGNVVGVELVSYSNTAGNASDLGLALFSVYVNGTSIAENICAVYGMNTCTRPTIFPILIQGGNTLYFNVDAGNCAASPRFTIGVRLYFDESNG